jgi:hypothetical protein
MPKNAGDEIQDSRHLAVDLVPRPEEHGEDRVEIAKAAAQRGGDQEGDRRAPQIVRHGRQPDGAKPHQEHHRDNHIGHDFQEAARGNDVKGCDRRQLQHRPVAGDGVAHAAAGVDKDVIGDEAGIMAQMGQTPYLVADPTLLTSS